MSSLGCYDYFVISLILFLTNLFRVTNLTTPRDVRRELIHLETLKTTTTTTTPHRALN
jgi:hypothetical protein